MNASSLNLRDLEYLVAVAQHGHFGKAALACHVSQPALSAQIKKLEGLLDVTLFERTNRQVAITDMGRALVAQARTVLEEAEKMITLAQSQAQPLAGPLRLGAIATLGPYLWPHLLGPIQKAFPRLELLLKEGLTDTLLADLRNGTLDAVLAAQTFDESGYSVTPIFKEPFLLAVPKSHALAAKPNPRVSDLNASDMVLLEDGHCLRDESLAFCPANRRGNIREYHVTGLETLRQIVATGAGYTLIPLLAVNEDEKMKSLLKYRRLEGKDVTRTIVLVCRDRFSRKKEIEMLAAFIRGKLPSVHFEKTSLSAVN